MILDFVVPGKVKPKERPRTFAVALVFAARTARRALICPACRARLRATMRTCTTPGTSMYETGVAALATAAMREAHASGPVEGPLAAEFIAYFARTKRTPPQERFPLSIRRADFDNAIKAITDAMQGVVYKNDKQIVDGHVCLRYCPIEHPDLKPHVRVRIWKAGKRDVD